MALIYSVPTEREVGLRPLQQAGDDVNATLSEYRDQTRVADGEVFRTDAWAALRLATATHRAPQSVNTSTRLLADADRQTANQSVTDAERALDQFEGQLDRPGEKREVEAWLRSADRAMDRADGIRERARQSAARSQHGHGSDKRTVAQLARSRARAITQYQTAWRHSQRALDELAESTTPNVTITSRADPVWNGTGTRNQTVVGTVRAVRPTNVANVTIQVGNESLETPVRARPVPASQGMFWGTVTRHNRSTTAIATLTDKTQSEAERGGSESVSSGWSDHPGVIASPPAAACTVARSQAAERSSSTSRQSPPAVHTTAWVRQSRHSGQDDRSGGTGLWNPGLGSSECTASSTDLPEKDAIALDGDALSGEVERTSTKTDPLDPNSNSTRTWYNESQNSRVDGREDFDGDSVLTSKEASAGTDPFDRDTDNDTLPDRVELDYRQLSPTQADADGDGIREDREDTDGDSLTTSRELEAGTSPFTTDTDSDGLADDSELELGTDPVAPDTDGEGLLDGEEPELGTDPLLIDTDGDGIVDANETFSTTRTNSTLGATVNITGEGNVARGVTISDGATERLSTPAVSNASVSELVAYESEQAFDNATVSIEYDETALENESSAPLAVFTFNESLGTFVPLNSTVDTETNTVSAETPHFSKFVVFDVRNWVGSFSADSASANESSERAEPAPVDVTFIIDSSGSMRWNDPAEFRKQASKEFVGALLGQDRAGVVDFDGSASVEQELTGDLGAVNLTIERLDASAERISGLASERPIATLQMQVGQTEPRWRFS